MIEIFYMLIKNDANVLIWLFNTIDDSFKENKSSDKQPLNSFMISLEIIEILSESLSRDEKLTLNDLPEYILNSFENLIKDLDSLNEDCVIRLFDCMRSTLLNFSKLDRRFVKVDKLVESLLEMSVTNSRFNNAQVVRKLSYIFKVYSLK